MLLLKNNRNHIRLELMKKGVSEDAIDTALEGLSPQQETDSATAILEKYMRGKTCDKTTLQKAYRYLMGKGYDYEVIKSALTAYGDCEDE